MTLHDGRILPQPVGLAENAEAPVLEVRDLAVEFKVADGWRRVVDGVSLSVGRGQAVGMVGESGSGKTVTALAVMGLLSTLGARCATGSIRLEGRELADSSEPQWRRVRGGQIGMIFQQPTRSLNPAFTVGQQLAETARLHLGLGRKAAWRRAVEMLQRVEIPNAEKRAQDYPFAYSGGMAQRAMIALALIAEPTLLVADEPTTALDVTVQARILELLQDIQKSTGVGMLFVSHDLAVVGELCDTVNVFYAGQVVERASLRDLVRSPKHPYTAGLMNSVPVAGQGRRLTAVPGTPPDFGALPSGCRFHPRCQHAEPGLCDHDTPRPRPTNSGHVLCARADELRLTGLDES